MVFRFQSYGKNFIKSCKTSPDVYIQLALQLAYFKYFLLNFLINSIYFNFNFLDFMVT